jgi:hypothetical protein
MHSHMNVYDDIYVTCRIYRSTRTPGFHRIKNIWWKVQMRKPIWHKLPILTLIFLHTLLFILEYYSHTSSTYHGGEYEY